MGSPVSLSSVTCPSLYPFRAAGLCPPWGGPTGPAPGFAEVWKAQCDGPLRGLPQQMFLEEME